MWFFFFFFALPNSTSRKTISTSSRMFLGWKNSLIHARRCRIRVEQSISKATKGEAMKRRVVFSFFPSLFYRHAHLYFENWKLRWQCAPCVYHFCGKQFVFGISLLISHMFFFREYYTSIAYESIWKLCICLLYVHSSS